MRLMLIFLKKKMNNTKNYILFISIIFFLVVFLPHCAFDFDISGLIDGGMGTNRSGNTITNYYTNEVTNTTMTNTITNVNLVSNGVFLTNYSITTNTSDGTTSGRITQDTTIEGIVYKSGHILSLYTNNGQVARGTIKNDTTIDGVVYHGGLPIYYYPNGKVSSGYLKSNQVVRGVRYKERKIIYFHDNGGVRQGELRFNQVIQGNSRNWHDHVRFNRTGNLTHWSRDGLTWNSI